MAIEIQKTEVRISTHTAIDVLNKLGISELSQKSLKEAKDRIESGEHTDKDVLTIRVSEMLHLPIQMAIEEGRKSLSPKHGLANIKPQD